MMINELAAETLVLTACESSDGSDDTAQYRQNRRCSQAHITEVDKDWVKNIDIYSQGTAACAYVNYENSYGVINRFFDVLAQTRQDHCLNRPQLLLILC